MRKRSPRVVWLPPDPTLGMAGGTLVYQRWSLPIPSPATEGDGETLFIPITIDSPQIDATVISLADVESSAYRLRRLVGKIYASVVQDTTSDSDGVLCSAGFIVLQVDGSGNPIRTSDEQSPAGAGNSSDPWIWRRTWLLANGAAAPNADASDKRFADQTNFSNYEGEPSALDGPHIDQKTARIVSQDQRLFLVTSMTGLIDTTTGSTVTEWALDLRILASMRTSQGNRRNASR